MAINKRMFLDFSKIQEHLRLIGEMRCKPYTLNERAMRKAIKDAGLFAGGYYVSLHQLTNEYSAYQLVNPSLYIPLGKVFGQHPFYPDKRVSWDISISGTPGSQIYSGLETNLYQIHFKLLDK